MSVNEEQLTSAHYRKLLETHGSSYLALNWGSEQSQMLRFSVLSEVGKLAGHSVLDVGCGLGDLAGWLEHQQIDTEYVGLDLTDSLVVGARQRFPGKRFEIGSIADPQILANEKFDFVVASGIFATYATGGAPWMERALSRMWELARHAVAFNSLSSWAPQADPGEYYADPSRVIDFCRSLTPRIQMRHDYHARDFTVFLYRDIAR
jgi:SAM-dependent methyltransferase